MESGLPRSKMALSIPDTAKAPWQPDVASIHFLTVGTRGGNSTRMRLKSLCRGSFHVRGFQPERQNMQRNQSFRATKSAFPSYTFCDLAREIAMSNQNQNPGQQNQNPGQKPGQQQGGGQKPGQQQQDPNRQGQKPGQQGQQDRDR